MLAAAIVGSLASFFGSTQDSYDCPTSPALSYASCKVTASADKDCDAVRYEMLARVNGQYATWHDPHNNGTYTLLSNSSPSKLELKRLTGDKKYTDKINFVFEPNADFGCTVRGCSRSQVFSIGDFSTNYCNMFSLYCSSKDGCKHVESDITMTEMEVKPSAGATTSKRDCLTV